MATKQLLLRGEIQTGGSNWSILPDELLHSILDLLSFFDQKRVSMICVAWRVVAGYHRIKQLPYLMIRDGKFSAGCVFFSFLDNKFSRYKLTEARNRCFVGSSYGWLVTVDANAGVCLLNPVSRAQIELPSLTTLPCARDFIVDTVGRGFRNDEYVDEDLYEYGEEFGKDFIQKVVLSSNPTLDNHCMVFAIHYPFDLAFARLGDDKWTVLSSLGIFEDIIFYNQQIYSVGFTGKVIVFDVSSQPYPRWTVIAPSLLDDTLIIEWKKYLVVSSAGDLLLVARDLYLDKFPCKTAGFKVFKLNNGGEEPNPAEWVEVKSLGDEMLFLGTNTSLCLSYRDFPECQGNCIYFTNELDPSYTESYDAFRQGVYNLTDGSIKPCYDITSQPQTSAVPVWVQILHPPV